MTIKLLLHTLSTSTPVIGECCVYWQNAPKASAATKLIDATPLTLETIWPLIKDYRTVVIAGIDLLLPLKAASAYQVLSFVRALGTDREVTVLVNSDDSLRSGQSEQEVLLKSLAHSASEVVALRSLPSGKDKDYAGMVRFTRGYACTSSTKFKEGERLFKYQENMIDAVL